MRLFLLPLLALGIAILSPGAKKPATGKLTGEGKNEQAALQASLLSPEEVTQAVGHDFGGHFTVVEVKVTALGHPLNVKLDDFVLRTDRDGEKSSPFAANQIAGTGAITVHQRQPENIADGRSSSNLHIPGLSGRRKSKKTDAPKADADTPKEPAPMDDKEAAELKTRLLAKVLQEKSITDSASGLLFFSLEKQRPKDLELIYAVDPANKIHLRFK